MDKIPIKQLITHVNPDLDAMMSVLLMRTFGEEKYPGASSVGIEFCSAGKLPDGKTAKELEQEGIIALDIGGGRFDTHPTEEKDNESKRELSATDLVAKGLKVLEQEPAWEALVTYTRLQDTTGHSMYSSDYLHHLVAIHTIILGLEIRCKGDSKAKLEQGMLLLRNIPEYTKAEKQSIEEENARLLKLIEDYLLDHKIDTKTPLKQHRKLSEWYKRLKAAAANTFPSDLLDQLVNIKTLVLGAFYYKGEAHAYKVLELSLNAILAREQQWVDALKEIEKGNVLYRRINKKITVIGIESQNGLVIKAARYKRRADLILFRDANNGGTSILINRKGVLGKRFDMKALAARIRLVESCETNTTKDLDYEQLTSIGEYGGWFVHQSENFIIKGSSKAPDFIPSKIPLKDLAQVIYNYVGEQYKHHHFVPRQYKEALDGYQMHRMMKKFNR